MAVSYAHANDVVLRVGLEAYMRDIVRPQILAMLKTVAQRMVQYIDSAL